MSDLGHFCLFEILCSACSKIGLFLKERICCHGEQTLLSLEWTLFRSEMEF